MRRSLNLVGVALALGVQCAPPWGAIDTLRVKPNGIAVLTPHRCLGGVRMPPVRCEAARRRRSRR